MYGFMPKGSLADISDIILEFDGAGTFAAHDLVKADGSSGEIVVATAASEVVGVALEAGTSSSTGVAVNVTPWLTGLMDNDNDTRTISKSYTLMWGDLIGATGAMYLDTSSLSTTQATLYNLRYNPQGFGFDSDTSIALVEICENSLWQGKIA